MYERYRHYNIIVTRNGKSKRETKLPASQNMEASSHAAARSISCAHL